jgi:hypothetical protein
MRDRSGRCELRLSFIGEPQPALAGLLPEHAVLFAQVVDDLGLFPVHEAGAPLMDAAVIRTPRMAARAWRRRR